MAKEKMEGWKNDKKESAIEGLKRADLTVRELADINRMVKKGEKKAKKKK